MDVPATGLLQDQSSHLEAGLKFPRVQRNCSNSRHSDGRVQRCQKTRLKCTDIWGRSYRE